MSRFDGPVSGNEIPVIIAQGSTITIPDSHLLFTAHFSRSGHDLVLTGDDGKAAVILDYFGNGGQPALASPEGATLSPSVVSALAGSMTPGQYAQAGDQQAAASIGKVITLEGSATAQHADGTVVQLSVGAQVAQGDVLQTAAGGSVGLVFVDGTVMSLTSDSRMVLDNLVYQAGGSNNSLTFSVVQGTFSFVTGQVAPTGEMRIDTPVASLGIRGTVFGGGCAAAGPCTYILANNFGTNVAGRYDIIGPNGQILQTVTDVNLQYTVSANGLVVTEPLDPTAQEIIDKLIQAFERRAAENEDDGNDDEDGSGPNGGDGTPTDNAGGSGIETFSATSATDSAIQTGLTEGLESLSDESTEEATSESTTTESTASTDTGSSVAPPITDSGTTPPPPPDDTISDDTGTAVEDGGGTSGTVGGGVVAQPETPGEFGTFSINENGEWTYLLNNDAPAVQALAQGQTAIETFEVAAANGGPTATVEITITGTNDAPEAAEDTVEAVFGASTTFTAAELLANDTDVDSDLSIVAVTSGTGGTAVLNLDGSVTFTPTEGFSGTATFTYAVSDGIATGSPVTVNVTIDNQVPTASPVTLEAVLEDTESVTITEADLLAGVTDPDGPSLTITALSIATGNGLLVDNEDGTWTYTPAANDDTGVTFDYTVSDGTSSDSSTASLDITPVNDDPVAAPVTLAPIAEDSGARLITEAELLAGVTDVDSTSLTITSLAIATGSGLLVDNENGTWTYTPAADDDTGVTFDYTVSDGASSVSSTASLDITPDNDDPLAAPVTLAPIAEDSGARLITEAEILAGVTDVDSTSLTITSLSIATGSGLLVDNENGTWTYTPAADDDTGVTFDYTVTDGASSDSSTASLDITPDNDDPLAAPVTLAPIAEDSGARVITEAELLAGVTDPDGPSLTITALSIASGSGLLVDNENGTWTYMPAANDDTGVTFNYTVFDGTTSDSSTASLDITPVNDAPAVTGDLEANINNGEEYTLTPSDLGFTDPDDAAADVVFTVTNLVNGVVLVNGVEALSFTGAQLADGLVSFEQPDGSENNEASFDFLLEDGNEDSSPPATGTFNFTVTNYITGDENPNTLDGTAAVDIISGLESADVITGNGDDDTLIGGGGVDTYVWNEGDGYDTIVGDNLSQDIIQINGVDFYDYNFEVVGNDLIVGVAGDANYDWSAAGGNLTIKDFLAGGDTLDYMVVDLGEKDEFYNPAGEGADSRFYFSAINGIDQGNYYELVIGTDGNDVITDAGGTWINRLFGFDGDDTITAADSGPSVLLGGNGDDTLIGGTNNDDLRGGRGSDSIDGGEGYDTLSYHRPATSGQFTHGVFVNLSDDAVTYDFYDGVSTEQRTVEAHTALDNWWNPDTPDDGVDFNIANIEQVVGSHFNDVIIGGTGDEWILGGDGADILDGSEGYDTISFFPPFGSPASSQGVFVNISGAVATYDFNGDLDVTVGPGEAIDNWGNTDTISDFESIIGSDLDDVLVAGEDGNYIDGGAGDDIIVGGGGYDDLVGGEGSDSFVFGTEWGETWIGDFDLGTDLLRFQGDVGIDSYELVDTDEFEGEDSTRVTLTTGATIYLYGVTDIEDVSQLLAPPILGTTGPEDVDGSVFNDVLVGGLGDDTLNGRAGVDVYEWNENDGFDTIIGDNLSQDIIQINGTFYDYNFELDGNDLLIGAAADGNYLWESVGGNLRIENFLAGGDSIAYMEIDLGPENQFYSPNGGNARLYFSAVTGTDQGEYFEAIIGTAGNDVMTDVGGAGVNKFWGMDGDDTMTAAAGTVSVLVGGKGEDTLTGAELEDTLRGGSGDDTMDGGAGVDIVRYDRGDASETATHGVFVNLSDSDVTYDFNSELGVTVAAGHAIDKWGDLDTLTNIENVRGSSLDDIIVGSDDDNVIMGDQGNDIFQGNDGVDTYIWRAGDGNDTIIGDDSSQDVIQFDGSFYDFDWDYDGDDLIIGVVNDENYEFAGTIRIQDFTAGGDSIDYMEADLNNNNLYYNPGGEGANARIYFSAVDGIDQGNYFELVVGTSGNDEMEDAGGTGVNWFDGRAGDDIITAADDGRTVLIGGLGNDTLTGGSMNDQFRGGAGNDIINGGGEEGIDGDDLVRYDRPSGSGPYTHGVVVNLSDGSIVLGTGEGEYYFNGLNASVDSNQAIGNWEILETWASNVEGRVDTDVLSGIESVRGSTFDDLLIGSEGDNNIIGDQGDDTIIGGGGDDFLVGQFGSDYIDGGEGSWDSVWYGQLDGVTINLSLAENQVDEGGGVFDTLVSIEGINGSSGADSLTGDDGNNFIDGLAGDDYIDGGDGTDAVDFYGDPNGVIVNLADGSAFDGFGGTDELVSIEDIWGSFYYGDDLTGDSSTNYIDGRGGDDTIKGGAGNDWLVGGDGYDIFVFGTENDYTTVDTINDFVVGTDYLRLEDGLGIDHLELIDTDFDEIADSTRVVLDDVDVGVIDLMGVIGVSDPNDLLEPQNLFFMAMASPEDGGASSDGESAKLSSTAGDSFDTPGYSGNGGRGGWSPNRGNSDRRSDDSRNHEFTLMQAAAALGGVVAGGTHFLHTAEAASPQADYDLPHKARGDDHAWTGGSGHNDAAQSRLNTAIDSPETDTIAAPAHTHLSGFRSFEHADLNAIGTPDQDTADTEHEWQRHETGESRTETSGGMRAHHNNHHGEAGASAIRERSHNDDAVDSVGQHASETTPGVSGSWHGANALDVGPLLDFSGIPLEGAKLHVPSGAVWQRGDFDLPGFENIIDLRHDLFADAPARSTAKSDALAQPHGPQMHGGEFGFGGGGAVDFVHNLASDLESAAQTHDVR